MNKNKIRIVQQLSIIETFIREVKINYFFANILLAKLVLFCLLGQIYFTGEIKRQIKLAEYLKRTGQLSSNPHTDLIE